MPYITQYCHIHCRHLHDTDCCSRRDSQRVAARFSFLAFAAMFSLPPMLLRHYCQRSLPPPALIAAAATLISQRRATMPPLMLSSPFAIAIISTLTLLIIASPPLFDYASFSFSLLHDAITLIIIFRAIIFIFFAIRFHFLHCY